MKAFHNDEKIKQKYMTRVKAHALADEIIKGQYWDNGKGCAVGCTIHGADHKKYETELGIPEWLARVEDCIFEGLENEEAKLWPGQFLSAIIPGADLNKILHPFLAFVVRSSLKNFDNAKYPEIVKVINDVIELHETETPAWSAAESAAESAAWSAARSAAWSAARSAAWSAAETAAETAARSAARSAAESAAWSAAETAAWSAARSAAWSAAWSAAETAARSAARSAAYKSFADKLLELLKACP